MRVLIVIFKNKDLRIFYIKKTIENKDILQFCESMFPNNLKISDVDKYLITEDNILPLLNYHHCIGINNEKIILDKQKVILTKLSSIRGNREFLFKKLDLNYKIAQQKKDLIKQRYIERNTQFLRDLPQNLNFNSFENVDDIINLNVFNNVTEIKIINPGENYSSIPKIIIDPPEKNGIIAQATCLIHDGKIIEITLTNFGSNYTIPPKVTISPPNNGVQAIAESIIDNIII